MKRLVIVFCLLIFAFFIIIARLFYWQVMMSEQLTIQAENQYFLKKELPSKRGEILFSDGQLLAGNEKCFLVFAEPKRITDKEKLVQKLSSLLKIEEGSLSAQLDQKNLQWVPLKHQVEKEVVEALKELQLPGIGFEEETRRFYPEGSMSAHLLGFVGKDIAGQDKGYFGLEGYYDHELKGRSGFLSLERDAQGNPILTSSREEFSKENGNTLVLNIDRAVQYIVETALRKGIERYGASAGGVILMEPQTGKILAMASHPAYDPGKFLDFEEERYKNPLVSESYEPGSIFKLIVMAAALDQNIVDPETSYEEKGPVLIGGYRIKTWDDKYHGKITMTQVLEKSSNVGMVWVALKLGIKNLFPYLEKFGFGSKTKIDLQEEFSPYLKPMEEWKEIDLATVSFGQGIAVTPIQMVRAVGAVANGGLLVRPYLVKTIISEDGKERQILPQVGERVIKPQTAAVLTEMMVSAVENGEVKWERPKGFRIAGKTGTAQIPVAGHYDPQKTVASFIGFAPADEPKFVMLVTLREPTASPWGSETAAPLFFDIATQVLNYYDISP